MAGSEWLDENNLTWLAAPPKIKLFKVSDAFEPDPLSWDEQTRLFQQLPKHSFFQAKNVALGNPQLAQISSTGVPNACCCKAYAICCSVKRDLFTTCSFLSKADHAGNSTF